MNNENNCLNENESKIKPTTSNTEQQQTNTPWTKRMFNWMYNETTPRTSTTTVMNEFCIDQDDKQELDDDLPEITVNSPPSLDVSTEFSSASENSDTHLVTITRLNEKGGLGNVIRKLRTGFKKEDEDLTRFWMPDKNSFECFDCNFKFSTIRRRHHCRICGQIFCSRCCSRKIDGDKVGYAPNTKVRSCNYCFNAINTCVKPNTQQIPIQPQQQLRSQESIETIDLDSRLSNATTSNPNQLPKVFADLFGTNNIETNNEMSRFRSPRRSIDESTIARRLSVKKQENKLQSTPNFISETTLKERIDKRKKQLFLSSEENFKLDQPLEPSWVKEIDQKDSCSFDNLNSEIESIEIVLNLEEDSNLLTGIEGKINENDFKQHFLTINEESKEDLYSSNEQIKIQDTIDNLVQCSTASTSLLTFYSDDQLNEDLINSIPILLNREEQITERNEHDKNVIDQFNSVYEKFFKKLALQLLKKEKLGSSWFPILKELITQITNTVKPNSDILEEMDIRKHVKIKTITGGNKQDSKIVNGVVFTKHVAHRKMRKEIENPKILLLTCPIVFQQRMYQKFISLEKLFLQENNYMENLIEKISSFKPNIIVLDKIVSFKAQELLCKKKITVVYNVKSNILFKISRLTGGEIVDSIDAQINIPKFGECDSFYLKTFNNNQTLMFFDGCKPDSGCTILLRGSIFKNELKKVKKILKFLLFCDYNWKYEKAFLFCSSAYLTQSTVNEFVQFYDLNEKSSIQKIKNRDQYSHENKEIALTELMNFDNQDPLMNNNNNESNTSNRSTIVDGLELSGQRSNQQQMTKENQTDMCKFINDQILSISPFIYYKLPYLLTNEANKCLIKKFISCRELFNSVRFQEYVNSNKICLTVDDAPYKKEESFNELKKNEMHPFLLTDLKEGVDDEKTQTLCALYRSSDLIKVNNQLFRSEDDGEEEIIDPFNILSHQLFPVLYCNYSLSTTQNPFCNQPVIMEMEFYVDHDFSLGNYLRRYCFTKNTDCECGNYNVDHISKFSHTFGSIYVRCKELKPMKRPNSNSIISWSWCQICKSSSQSKVLNKDALSLSFGKFLQLKIYGNHFRRVNCEQSCLNHSLFHDHFQYFAYKDMVASFKYYPVILREITLPCSKLNVNVEISNFDQLNAEFQDIHRVGIFQTMSKIFEQICAYQAESDLDNNDLQFKLLFAAEVKNRFELKAKLDEIHNLLESEPKNQQLRLTIANKIIFLKQLISSFVTTWNIKLNEYEANRKKEDRLSGVIRSAKFPRISSSDADQTNSPQNNKQLNVRTSSSSFSRQNSDQHPIIKELLEASLSISSKQEEDQTSEEQSKTNSMINSIKNSYMNSREYLNEIDDTDLNSKINVVDTMKTDQLSGNNQSENNNLLEKLNLLEKSRSSESISSIVFGCTPGIQAGLGNEMILHSESDRENYEVVHCQAARIPSVDENDELLNEPQNEQQKQIKEESSESRAQMTSSKLESKLNNLQAQSQAMNLLRNQTNVGQKKEPIRQSVKSLINNFLSGPNTMIIPDPFLSTQHYLLPMRDKLPIVLDDNDIGSIIAYSLTTVDYERKLHEIQSNLTMQKTRYNSQTGAYVTSNTMGNAQIDNNLKEYSNTVQDTLNASSGISSGAGISLKENQCNDTIDVQFNDSTTNYYCCIHFASQFRKLRSEVLDTSFKNSNSNKSTSLSTLTSSQNSSSTLHQTSQQSNQSESNFHFDTEEAYIRSISHTVEWWAKGGKSKALFSKTLNDRFVIKVVRKSDIQLFIQMANSYFDYLHRTRSECKPTLFAKIIGAYNVSWRDNINNTSMKKYVLVMENVFYERKIKQKFDLKGSEKNRLASTKTSDDVLLDENLTKIIRDNPFYIRSHSKLVLQEAIDNDSKFLCDLNIIDYSLLVGIDEERKELVVGIIDYIQTYTSMKKFETVIKSMGKVLPTVVDPQSYMIRFQNKMNQYFQCLPDQWYTWYGISFNLN